MPICCRVGTHSSASSLDKPDIEKLLPGGFYRQLTPLQDFVLAAKTASRRSRSRVLVALTYFQRNVILTQHWKKDDWWGARTPAVRQPLNDVFNHFCSILNTTQSIHISKFLLTYLLSYLHQSAILLSFLLKFFYILLFTWMYFYWKK